MAVSVIEYIDDNITSEIVDANAVVVEVINTTDTATDVVSSVAVTDVVRDGGNVTNVLWGYGLPSSPTEGMIFLDVS